MDDDVEETTGRLAFATKKVKLLIKRSNECKLMIGLFLLVLVLGGLLIIFLKVAPASESLSAPAGNHRLSLTAVGALSLQWAEVCTFYCAVGYPIGHCGEIQYY